MNFNLFRRKKKKDNSVILYTEIPEVSETGTKIPKDVLEEEVKSLSDKFLEENLNMLEFLKVTDWLKRQIEANKNIFKDKTEVMCNSISYKVKTYLKEDEYKELSVYDKCKKIMAELYMYGLCSDDIRNVLYKINDEMIETFGWAELAKEDLTDFQKSVSYHKEENSGKTGSASIVIDEIGESDTMKRAKHIMDRLNKKDKIIDFKTELRKFQNEIHRKSDEINELCNSISERINKYLNDTNVI